MGVEHPFHWTSASVDLDWQAIFLWQETGGVTASTKSGYIGMDLGIWIGTAMGAGTGARWILVSMLSA